MHAYRMVDLAKGVVSLFTTCIRFIFASPLSDSTPATAVMFRTLKQAFGRRAPLSAAPGHTRGETAGSKAAAAAAVMPAEDEVEAALAEGMEEEGWTADMKEDVAAAPLAEKGDIVTSSRQLDSRTRVRGVGDSCVQRHAGCSWQPDTGTRRRGSVDGRDHNVGAGGTRAAANRRQ